MRVARELRECADFPIGAQPLGALYEPNLAPGKLGCELLYRRRRGVIERAHANSNSYSPA